MKRRKNIIVIAIIMSFVLYLTGVLSGLYANKLTEDRTTSALSNLKNETSQNIFTLEQGTNEQLTQLRSYVTFLDANLKNMQLQQTFINTLPATQACRASGISTRYLINQLATYRQQLPFRLEEYERDNQLTPEYKLLKAQYNTLSIQTWIFTKEYQSCSTNIVNVLYFYSRSCRDCVQQGVELDKFTADLTARGKNVVLFTIDYEADDPTISFVKEYYNINSVPAVIINDKIYQGRLFNATSLEADAEVNAGAENVSGAS